ncbi:hypothetical protein R3W88_022635 [Solanum pinnatisectum]|uniref:Uncharacterized protein n=1 Tax=Solanum pinnatisectum TaxID=50273 RepID=A0AAV9LWR4_9SOLN|nr:hypothetical protein R3W88_022635 [Solanum pinnatisectum]
MTIPDLPNHNSTIRSMQQILGAHVTTPYKPHVPPVYAVEAHTLKMPAVVNVPPTYVPRPRPNLKARNDCVYTHIAEPYVQLFERLRTSGVLQLVEGKLLDPILHNFDGNKRCAYHSGIQGHDTEDC